MRQVRYTHTHTHTHVHKYTHIDSENTHRLHWFHYLVLYQHPPLPPTPYNHQQSFHLWPPPLINLCHLHTSHTRAHTHTYTETLMQACSISSYRSFFFSCLNTLYHSVPASPCSVSALPHISSLPSSSLPLSPSPTSCNFFPGVTSRLARLAAYARTMLYLLMGVCYSVFDCVFELAPLRSCIWRWESRHVGREAHVCKVCVCMCVCMSLFTAVCKCVCEWVREREREREGTGGERRWRELTDRGCGFYTAWGSKPQTAQRWLTSWPFWPQHCCSPFIFH